MTYPRLDQILIAQRALCARVSAEFEQAPPDLKVGISRALLAQPSAVPIRGVRYRPTPTTTGWYLWSGEDSTDPDFYVPMHLSHIWKSHSLILPYLGLARGWCFILAPAHEDIWYEADVAQLDG